MPNSVELYVRPRSPPIRKQAYSIGKLAKERSPSSSIDPLDGVRRLSLVRSNIFISHPGISWKSTVGGQIIYLGGLLDSRVRCGASYVHQWENTPTLWGVPSFVMPSFILLSLRGSGYHSSCTISPMAWDMSKILKTKHCKWWDVLHCTYPDRHSEIVKTVFSSRAFS